jgi:hypothetical protein
MIASSSESSLRRFTCLARLIVGLPLVRYSAESRYSIKRASSVPLFGIVWLRLAKIGSELNRRNPALSLL